MQLDIDEPRSKYCDKSPRDDPQGKNPHQWIDTISDEGIKLRDKRIQQTESVNAEYRNVVKLIDMVKGVPSGCIIELVTIAEVQVRWHVQDFEEKLSLYELIIKRIREHTERL